jgi:hypothetical protein
VLLPQKYDRIMNKPLHYIESKVRFSRGEDEDMQMSNLGINVHEGISVSE